jgi:hypothetical protein
MSNSSSEPSARRPRYHARRGCNHKATADEDGAQTGLGRGAKVVVKTVADVGDLMGLMTG